MQALIWVATGALAGAGICFVAFWWYFKDVFR